MSKTIRVVLVALVVLLGLAAALNPSAERHREKIKEAIAERSQFEQLLGIGHLTAFMSKYKSVGVASYTVVDDKVVSVGVLGMVFVRD